MKQPRMGRPELHGASGGGRRTREYYTWQSMRQRCENPAHPCYKNYGGRGLRVCNQWSAFAQFLADMGPRPVGTWIERIDNDRGYEPDNCRWATPKEQAQNKRPHPVVPGSLRNKAREAGLPYHVVYQRVKLLGWTEQEALTQPMRGWQTKLTEPIPELVAMWKGKRCGT